MTRRPYRGISAGSRKLFQGLFALIFLFSLLGVQPAGPVQADPSTYAWEAFNDCVVTGAITNPENTTGIVCYTNNTTGELKNFATGEDLGISVNVNTSGSVGDQTGSFAGAIPDVGTDAYNLFNGKASILGGIRMYTTTASTVTLTFTGLDSNKNYTFATTANRDDVTYTDRITGFTLSDVDSAINNSSIGATIEGLKTIFVTGYNTVNGYVARWENIKPGTNGAFTVTFTNEGTNTTAYGPSVFSWLKKPPPARPSPPR